VDFFGGRQKDQLIYLINCWRGTNGIPMLILFVLCVYKLSKLLTLTRSLVSHSRIDGN
jgi:hypothetical protein